MTQSLSPFLLSQTATCRFEEQLPGSRLGVPGSPASAAVARLAAPRSSAPTALRSLPPVRLQRWRGQREALIPCVESPALGAEARL